MDYVTRALVAAALFLAGCTTFTSSDCGPDWFAVGERDGVLGAQPQAEIYARRCGTAVDTERYHEGWRNGFSRRPRPTV